MQGRRPGPVPGARAVSAPGRGGSRGQGGSVVRRVGKREGGVVSGFLQGVARDGQGMAIAPLIESLRSGLPMGELQDLQLGLGLPMEKLVPLLGISKATLHRRKVSGRLDPAESDRVVRLARLLGQAASVLESLEQGRRWLLAPQVGLGGAVPLEFAETEVGAREVENLLGRIEHGVYS